MSYYPLRAPITARVFGAGTATQISFGTVSTVNGTFRHSMLARLIYEETLSHVTARFSSATLGSACHEGPLE